jgi:hypothetical protein
VLFGGGDFDVAFALFRISFQSTAAIVNSFRNVVEQAQWVYNGRCFRAPKGNSR